MSPGPLELLRAYNQIADDQMRRDVLALVKSAARLAQARASGEAVPACAGQNGVAPSA